ncbi:MAG TPA: class I SAM-dependent methyltransferase [Thermoanaerobaculia bacterium]|nr:class I SAM-dependent methyltransferase [Thermoanaerobaculia bacterium]
MAHPLCRRAINRRISGSEHEWPVDWFARITGGGKFRRGLSWGCGLGAFERSAMRAGLVEEIDAFDVSSQSLEEARAAAAREGLGGIHYSTGNFDDPVLPRRHYDIVFFHAALHHSFALERLFRRLAFSLKPRGWIYIDEYIGPSRSHWSPDGLRLAQAVLDMVPEEAKLTSTVPLPIEPNDPSEGVRSDEIPRFFNEFFDVVEWKPYGGQITDLVMLCVSREWAASEQGSKSVQAMLDLEDWQLDAMPSSNHHVVACGRLKRRAQLARPLSRQALQAVRRRLRRFRSASATG